MLVHSCLKRIRHISQHTRRRMILRIHSYKACGSWSIPSKLLVAILIRPAARLLREPHTAARRLLAVFAGHQPLLLEAATGATALCRRSRGLIRRLGERNGNVSSIHFRNRIVRSSLRSGGGSGRNFFCGRRHYSFLRIFTAFQPS